MSAWWSGAATFRPSWLHAAFLPLPRSCFGSPYTFPLSNMSRSRLFAVIASAPMAMALAVPLLTSPARAIGLTGPFNLANWDLVFTDLSSTPTVVDSEADGSYQCDESLVSTACVDGPDLVEPSSIETTPTGGFTVVGATTGDYGPYAGTLFDTAWVLDPVKSERTQNYQLSFNFLFGSTDEPEAILGYFSVNGVITSVQSSTDGQSSVGSFVIAPSDVIAFGVRSSILDGNSGTVNITNFSALNADVPGPLPALGAAAAFGWSRRLRRRIRGRAGGASL
jgi:hypothetical protein